MSERFLFDGATMKSMDILFLLLMMELLENHLIYIFSSILIYIMIIHISMAAPMMFTLVTWRLMIFLAPLLVYLKLEELRPTLWWRFIWLKNIIIGSNILWCYMMIYIFMSVFMRLLWATWSLMFSLLLILFRFWWRFSIHLLDERTHGWFYWCTLHIIWRTLLFTFAASFLVTF